MIAPSSWLNTFISRRRGQGAGSVLRQADAIQYHLGRLDQVHRLFLFSRFFRAVVACCQQ